MFLQDHPPTNYRQPPPLDCEAKPSVAAADHARPWPSRADHECRRTVRYRSYTRPIVPRFPMAPDLNVRSGARIETRCPVRSNIQPLMSNGYRPCVYSSGNIRPLMNHANRHTVPSLMSVRTTPPVNSGSTLRPLMDINTNRRTTPMRSLMDIQPRPPRQG